ncbi:MAG: hypothetical protein C4K49_07570 [Candidatus Thorarchaeota archaeon]|nr:MAG: hypothetical protein C4K49_07570 [Candidatus Thorarchaeota archaeon]
MDEDTTTSFVYFKDIPLAILTGILIGLGLAVYYPFPVTFSAIPIDALSFIVMKNLFVLSILYFARASPGIQVLILMNNSLVQAYLISSAMILGIQIEAIVSLLFAALENGLFAGISLESRNNVITTNCRKVRYPLLIIVSSILEALIL